ncbi:MAG: ChaN family lipoprotein [Bacteroidota bacterium]
MNLNIFFLAIAPFFPVLLFAQSVEYKIYSTESKQEISLGDIAASVAEIDVLFFGEEHDDSLAHTLQAQLYAMLLEEYGTVTLSMEMFETDGQLVLDEYFSGYITEDKMVNDTRAWKNYTTDYRPMVELAKNKEQSIIAANAPRRYVNLVSRKGLSELENLPKSSKEYLPQLPIYTADRGYYDRFQEAMGGAGHGMSDNFFHAQCTWDATMAYRIYKHWKKNKKELIFHLNGRFHTDYQQGTITQLRRLNKKITIKNISCFSVANLAQIDWENYADQGSFLIVSEDE